jgi:predicted GNAT family acetyltransferase
MNEASAGAAGGIEHEERDGRGTFFLARGGERLAELTYVRDGEGHVTIDHTRVSETLSGQGVGKRLVHAAVDWARASGTRVAATCTFARSTFEREPALRDVLG